MHLLLILVALLSFPATTQAETSTNWERTGNEDGVELFKREVPGSNVVALRGDGNIEAPCAKVASILLGMKRAPEWVDSLRESRIVRKMGEFKYIEYNYIKTFPIIMLDRDFVSKVDIKVDPKGGLAKWIVNFFQKDWPKNTFAALRNQAAKDDIEKPAEFKTVVNLVETFHAKPPGVRKAE